MSPSACIAMRRTVIQSPGNSFTIRLQPRDELFCLRHLLIQRSGWGPLIPSQLLSLSLCTGDTGDGSLAFPGMKI